MEYRAEFMVIVCVLKTGDGSEGGVVHNNPCTRDSILNGCRKAGRLYAESAVTCKCQADLIRNTELSAKDCGCTKAHIRETGGMVDRSRYSDIKLLGNTILVPAYVCKDISMYQRPWSMSWNEY